MSFDERIVMNKNTEQTTNSGTEGFAFLRRAKKGSARKTKSSVSEVYIPFRQKVLSFLSKNALIITFAVIILAVGFSGRDLWINTINTITSRAVSSSESPYESALYRDVFLPMADMVTAGDDIEAFLLANNRLKRSDWLITFSNTPYQTMIYIKPRKRLSEKDTPTVCIRVPVKSPPFAYHEITMYGGPGKSVSVLRYASGNIYYYAGNKEKPLSDRQALDDIVKSWH